MQRKLMKRALLFVVFSLLLLLPSCEHNVYIDTEDEEENIWRVGEADALVYFGTANEAVEYIMNLSVRSITKTNNANRTITLMRPVLAEGSDGIIDSTYEKYVEDVSKRGSIIIPSSFTGDLLIDFNGYRYDFDNSCDAFFVINGGDNVYIYNGTSVIFSEANPEPYAITVDTRTVAIDEHLLDDRRENPKSVHVLNDGALIIESETEREKTYIKGDFKIDGSLTIEDGVVYIESIEKAEEATLEITGGEIHNPHDADSIVLPAIDKEKFEKNGGEHSVIHEWSTTPFKEEVLEEPTCTKEGLKRLYYKCIECNETTTKDVVIAKADHDHSGAYITDSEYHWRICPVCSKVIDKVAHSFSKWTKDEDNVWHKECTVCKRKEENKHLEHILVHHKYTAAECETDGNIEYWQCSICGECFTNKDGTVSIEESKTIIGKLGHDWDTARWSSNSSTHWHACKRSGCTAREDEKEHTNEFYYSALTTTADDSPFLTISHKCNVCGRSVSAEHKKEDGVFHLTPLDGFAYTYDRTTGIATITVTCPKSYTSLVWYDINGKAIECLNEKQCRSFTFIPDGKYGYRCELINNSKVIGSCYIELTQYKD